MSLRAGRDNCLRTVHVAVAPLEFGLQFDGKPRKIDKIPSREFPRCIVATALCLRALIIPRIASTERGGYIARRTLESNNEMHRVVAHFIRRLLGLEIKRAETAVAASGGVKLWVQIEHAFALQVSDAQIRIT
jgi:hypothetical protein